MPKGTTWTDEEIEAITKRWKAGDSAAMIARGLRGRSRNAVIAFVHRHGIVRPGSVQAAEKARRGRHPKRQTLRQPPRPTARVTSQTVVLAPKASLPLRPPVAAPDTAPVSFDALGAHDCKYPVTQASPHMFCGARRLDGRSYCAFHQPRTVSASQ